VSETLISFVFDYDPGNYRTGFYQSKQPLPMQKISECYRRWQSKYYPDLAGEEFFICGWLLSASWVSTFHDPAYLYQIL
jgi:hypothetical protein